MDENTHPAATGSVRVVPVEPTKAMLDAGMTALENARDSYVDSLADQVVDTVDSDAPISIYAAMIARHPRSRATPKSATRMTTPSSTGSASKLMASLSIPFAW